MCCVAPSAVSPIWEIAVLENFSIRVFFFLRKSHEGLEIALEIQKKMSKCESLKEYGAIYQLKFSYGDNSGKNILRKVKKWSKMLSRNEENVISF